MNIPKAQFYTGSFSNNIYGCRRTVPWPTTVTAKPKNSRQNQKAHGIIISCSERLCKFSSMLLYFFYNISTMIVGEREGWNSVGRGVWLIVNTWKFYSPQLSKFTLPWLRREQGEGEKWVFPWVFFILLWVFWFYREVFVIPVTVVGPS